MLFRPARLLTLCYYLASDELREGWSFTSPTAGCTQAMPQQPEYCVLNHALLHKDIRHMHGHLLHRQARHTFSAPERSQLPSHNKVNDYKSAAPPAALLAAAKDAP